MMIYALGGARITDTFTRPTTGNYFNKIVGGSFIFLGIGIVASN